MNSPTSKNFVEFSLDHPIYVWLLMITCLMGGWYGLENVGRLEDPPYPMKDAYVITLYPGASAEEVEMEVTETIETSLQELPQLRTLESKSLPGRSEIRVTIADQFDADELPQIWDELRRRVGEAAMKLPPGTTSPFVEDDFNDVYGLLYAVSTPGYSDAEIHRISRQISNALKSVPGVAKIHTAGEPEESIFIDIPAAKLARLGMPLEQLFGGIASENAVTPIGTIVVDGRRIRFSPKMAFDSVNAIKSLKIGKPGSTEILNLDDLATVVREPVEKPENLIRFNGERVFTIGVSVIGGRNVVAVGKQVSDRINALKSSLPLGVKLHPIYEQHDVVEKSIGSFLQNLLMSMVTVAGALCLFMGWRSGIVVSSVLLLTIGGTLYLMMIFNIELHRISLGALMIAMGMLVDNAIVVTESMLISARRGLSIRQSASLAVHRTHFALLGATVIGILAFAGIGLSDDMSGHFLNSLFKVIAISLSLSWILAVTTVPLLGSYLLNSKQEEENDQEIYNGPGYRIYRAILLKTLKYPWVSTVCIMAIVISCISSFGMLKKGFFPLSGTPIFYIDYYLPQGTDIATTSDQVREIEEIVKKEQGVSSVASFIGSGPTRFIMTFHSEQPNTAYAQLTVRVEDINNIDRIIARIKDKTSALQPNAEIHFTRTEFSPTEGGKIEARFFGNDSDTLRQLASDAGNIYRKEGLIDNVSNWRQREITLKPVFNEQRARIAGVGRQDLANALSLATTGISVGLYRENDHLIPIVIRAPSSKKADISMLMNRLVWSSNQQKHIPMSQIVTEFSLTAEDTIIVRRDRTRSISAMANPGSFENAASAFERVRPLVEKINLPPGYRLEWGGEFESSAEAGESIMSNLPATFLLMFLITILMFGQLRQPIIIWLTVPMSICGVVIGLLVTDMPFTFPALLGVLSLSGMLIKNSIVLVDEIDDRIKQQSFQITTIVEACISRGRPVLLAAATTIAGMFPLLADAFFAEMAVTIMSGLAFATLLTLIVVPVFYLLISNNSSRS